ncbi:MAG: hypothetical protein ACKVIX_01235 [Sphingomonadales bacterium]|jgi:hypothetical protein
MSFEQDKIYLLELEGQDARIEFYGVVDRYFNEFVESLHLEGGWEPLSTVFDFSGGLKPGTEYHLNASLTRLTHSVLFMSCRVRCAGSAILTSQAIWGKF